MIESTKKAVYFFCCDTSIDPVALRVFEASTRLFNLTDLPLTTDDYSIKMFEDTRGHQYFYVRTRQVVSHDYQNYLPMMNEHFASFDFAGVVNWHEGQHAPDRILTVHTTGDIVSGFFGPAHPLYTRNMMLALETNRSALGLHDFSVTTEATHWSGIVYGGDPGLIPLYPVPLVDVEIGSSPESWSNEIAVEVVARSLTEVFDGDGDGLRSLLCLGGVHLEPSFASAVLNFRPGYPLAVSHILANHWIVAGNYGYESGLDKLEKSVATIHGGQIDGIVYHDSIKSVFKQQARRLGEKLNVPVFKHRALARAEELPIW